MFGEQRHSGESFGAGFTGVLLHVRMRLEMGTKVRPVSKSSIAMVTNEGFLTSVGADMA